MKNFFNRVREAYRPAAEGTATTAPNSQVIARLLSQNARQHRHRYTAAILCMAIASACTGLSAWVMEDVINQIFIHREFASVILIAGSVATIFIVKGLAGYGQTVLLHRAGNAIVAGLQIQIYDNILKQSFAFFQQHHGADLVARMVVNSTSARLAIDLLLVSAGRDFLTLMALLAVMLSKDPVLTGLALVACPLAVYLVTRVSSRIRTFAKHEFEYRNQIIHAVEETTRGIEVVKAFSLESHMRERTLKAIRGIENRFNRMARLTSYSSPIMETMGGISFALVIFYGGFVVSNNDVDPGSIFAFLTALLLAYEPAKKLFRLRINLERELYSVRLLFDIIDARPEITDAETARPLVISAGDIELENVRFRHKGVKESVLHNLTLRAKPGQVTALVGTSGAGKTTILSLLERFFIPCAGHVRIDGQDLNDITSESLHQQIALVTQDTFLFAGTIRENIALGRPDATGEDIERAAKSAHAHEFIVTFENGYNTEIGTDGGNLSGGERQRLAIARAILRDAPILLLDEPTSALDAQAESIVQDALSHLMEGRTSLVIAHRLATIRNADVIHVLDEGRLVQSGTHDELLAEGGLYEHLYRLQFTNPPSANATAAAPDA